MCLMLRLDSDTIIHGRCDALGAAELALGGLNGNVPEYKVNLLQLASRLGAEPGAASTKIVRCQLADSDIGSELLYDMLDELLR